MRVRSFTVVALCASVFLGAQEVATKKNMKIMMKWKLTEYLDLGEEQAEKFFPKMNTHEKEMKKINDEIKKLRDEMERYIDSGTANKMVNRTNIEKIQKFEQKKFFFHWKMSLMQSRYQSLWFLIKSLNVPLKIN